MTKQIEYRTQTVEVRDLGDPKSDGSVGRIGGHAALFDTRSELIGGMFFETIQRGAFDSVLDDDVRALVGHDSDKLLGRVSAGTMEIGLDERGLTYEVDVPDTQVGRDLMVSMQRGDIRESSFGFSIARNGDEWDVDDEGREIRTITKISRLYDVSPVAFPAYADTDVAVRSHDNWKESRKNLENILHEDVKKVFSLSPDSISEMRELIEGLRADQEELRDFYEQLFSRVGEIDERTALQFRTLYSRVKAL